MNNNCIYIEEILDPTGTNINTKPAIKNANIKIRGSIVRRRDLIWSNMSENINIKY